VSLHVTFGSGPALAGAAPGMTGRASRNRQGYSGTGAPSPVLAGTFACRRLKGRELG